MKARRTGVVDHVVDQRTASVVVTRLVRHPKYGKRYRQSTKFLVDVASAQQLAPGMTVTIEECRPVSRRKHWRLVEVSAAPTTAAVHVADEALSPEETV